MRVTLIWWPMCLALIFATTGCVSYQKKVSLARSRLATGQAAEAASLLEKPANEAGKDQVLFLLDYALALHQAKQFEKSKTAFLKAEQLAEVKDYTSLSRQTGSLLTSERLVQYKSERFENILINAYLALNFLMLGQYDEAVVECRRIDEKLYKYKLDGEKYSKNFFARYLSAMIWEAQGQWDSAYIDYKNAYDINPNLAYLRTDLIRAAWRARRGDALKKWQAKWPSVKLATLKKDASEKGELVVVYQQGWIPRKKQRRRDYRFPYMSSVPADYQQATLRIGERAEPSQMVYDVARDATETMEATYKILVAKKIAGVVVKEIAADQIRQKNELLGFVAAIALHASDQADLRQWSTLPESFQVSKLYLSPGKHQIEVQASGRNGSQTIWQGEVEIKKSKPTFVTARTF